jgi:branched-subunit amino acid aminotransferase/4-amino-4-deoxychorismate lyase
MRGYLCGMPAGNFLYYNGKISKSGKAIIGPDNRSFRYGDGFFETMKVINGNIILADYHFERLFTSLKRMKFQEPVYFTRDYLEEQIQTLVKKNYHAKMARVRLTVFRGDGGLYDVNNHYPHHLIQSWDLNPANNQLNENGLVIDIYPDACKTADSFSSIKSNNYLPYLMAAIWAKEHKLNDAVLLNPFERVADASIANIFIIKDGMVRTPSLEEGPVNGVMRRHLLECFRNEGIPVSTGIIKQSDLQGASEIFLTNSIHGIRWVKQLGTNVYGLKSAYIFHRDFVRSLW